MGHVYSYVAIIVMVLFNYLFSQMLNNVEPNDWIWVSLWQVVKHIIQQNVLIIDSLRGLTTL